MGTLYIVPYIYNIIPLTSCATPSLEWVGVEGGLNYPVKAL